MPDSNLKRLKKETYLAMIKNSPGTRMFNNLLVKNRKTGEVQDVMKSGAYSCAFYVSSVLTILDMIDKAHSTVKTVIEKIEENDNWDKVATSDLSPGDVVVWEDITYENGEVVPHIGFYLDEKTAVSTSWTKREVSSHHPFFGLNDDGKPVREIAEVFRYKFD
jgi:hypothetical protein